MGSLESGQLDAIASLLDGISSELSEIQKSIYNIENDSSKSSTQSHLQSISGDMENIRKELAGFKQLGLSIGNDISKIRSTLLYIFMTMVVLGFVLLKSMK